MGPAAGAPAPAAEEWEELGSSSGDVPRATQHSSEDGVTGFFCMRSLGELGRYGAGLAPADAEHCVFTLILMIYSNAALGMKIFLICFSSKKIFLL